MMDSERSANPGIGDGDGDRSDREDDGQGTPSGGPSTGYGGRSVAARSEDSRDTADRAQRPGEAI